MTTTTACRIVWSDSETQTNSLGDNKKMKTNKIKVGVAKFGRTGLCVSEYDRTVTLQAGMRVTVVGTTTVGTVVKIEGEKVSFEECGVALTENVKLIRAIA